MSNEFTSVKGGDIWDPTKGPAGADGKATVRTEANEKDFIIGWFLGYEEGQGRDKNSRIYRIQPDEGDQKSVWGCMILDEQMDKITIGSYVMIKWLGKKQPKTATGRPYQDYEVLVNYNKGLHPSAGAAGKGAAAMGVTSTGQNAQAAQQGTGAATATGNTATGNVAAGAAAGTVPPPPKDDLPF